MVTYIYLLLKYWRKHNKSAAALLFSGVLLTAIIFVTLMSAREQCARYYHSTYDSYGHYDVLIANSDDDILAKATEGRSGYNYGVMYGLGDMGYADSRFAYGTIEDKHDIWHVPLDEGRMPETADEIAAVSTVLDACYWVGKCGDTITFDDRTFTVVGIINNEYGKWRTGSSLETASSDEIKASPYKVPLIFVGESDETPLYRIDILNNFFDLKQSPEDCEREFEEYWVYLHDVVEFKTRWYSIKSDRNIYYSNTHSQPTRFFLIIAWIGAAISVLSVFSVLRTVFTERRGRIDILKRIGMKKSAVGKLYAVECAIFAAIQIILGFLGGLAAYGGIFLFKTVVLGEKPYSGLTNLKLVLEKTQDPFLYAALISAVITIIAYIFNALTVNIKPKAPRKNRKPRSLSRCFGCVFRQRAVTIVQTAALTLICFSVLIGYMFYTDNGKTITPYLMYLPPNVYYTINGFNMEENNIAEYYSCSSQTVNTLGHMDNEETQHLPFITADYTAGIDDEIAEQLPEYAFATGYLKQTFIAAEESNYLYINEIDLSNEVVRQSILGLSSEEHQRFFDDGQLGSKQMYQTHTKLVPARIIESLSENVKDGALDINAINSGKEMLVTYRGKKPPFEVGETVTIYSIAAAESGYGIGNIVSAEVKVGAILQIPPSIGAVKSYTVRNDHEYNFLTTASGANTLGLHCARYTEIYSSEPLNGSIFPSSAEMRMKSLATMRRDDLIKKALQYGGTLLILLVMSLLGFAAYFNGIGMKIRLRSYDISVIRAVGVPVSELRKRLLISSIKIPLAASALAYGLVKVVQFSMEKAYLYISALYEQFNNISSSTIPVTFMSESTQDAMADTIDFLKKNLFLDNVMWEVKTELPALILLIILCMVTFFLTAAALKKFNGNIANDLSEGRTRQ